MRASESRAFSRNGLTFPSHGLTGAAHSARREDAM